MNKEEFKVRIAQQMKDDDSPLRLFLANPVSAPLASPNDDNLVTTTELYASEFNLVIGVEKIIVEGLPKFQFRFSEMEKIPSGLWDSPKDLSGEAYKKTIYGVEEILFDTTHIRFIVHIFLLDAEDYVFLRVNERKFELATFNLSTCRFDQKISTPQALRNIEEMMRYSFDRVSLFYTFQKKQAMELEAALKGVGSLSQARQAAITECFQTFLPNNNKMSRMATIIYQLRHKRYPM